MSATFILISYIMKFNLLLIFSGNYGKKLMKKINIKSEKVPDSKFDSALQGLHYRKNPFV
ncbi:hypothetical protein C1631_006140 [Chryseobacterium phosphatilyticum]|uniref:Uncharacterized protein n=1 Tax=Chryseobacterium phosphatilyticum TaxID=475075 RepID=A0A316XEP8_9FLAO|nr:hypothetical protein C1631_006140 [Chryseobacterium phosphatilyticum]